MTPSKERNTVLCQWNSAKSDAGFRTLVIRRLKPWWRVDENGFVVLTVRYGFKPIEFEKGKSAIAVGALDRLESVLTTLIAATRAGELDGLLEPVKRAEAGKAKKAA